jgi:general secretion pathway protein K
VTRRQRPRRPTALPEKPVKEQIVEQLLAESGVGTLAAEEIYQQLVDYLDADDVTAKQGQEADAWASVTPARGPANQMMRTINEIRLLPAFPQAAWPKVSKLLCALPDTDGTINVNTLTRNRRRCWRRFLPAC